MKIVAAKCPNCGANIDVDKNSDSTVCEYCGSKILVDDAIAKIKVDVSANVEIKNMPKYESYVKLGNRYYNEFLYREAKTEYKKALELNPDDIKLIFREKVCRVCAASFSRIEEDAVKEAFDQAIDKVNDKQERSEYAAEACNAMAYIINKSVDYYQNNNLDFTGVLNVRFNIVSCAINIKYFKYYILESDKENMLKALDYYISAMELATQNLKYKVSGTRTKRIYTVSFKSKRGYLKNKKEALAERKLLINGDKDLENKSTLMLLDNNIKNMGMVLFLTLISINFVLGIISLEYEYPGPLLFFLANFIYQLASINKVKVSQKSAKKVNIISIVLFALGLIVFLGTIGTTSKYINNWSNENIKLVIEKDNAILKFENSDSVISGAYSKNCNSDNTECTINIAGYSFKYSDEKLCYLENNECTQYLKKSESDFDLKENDKITVLDDCSETDNVTLTCGENNYYVCSNGKEYKNYSCNYEEEQTNNKSEEKSNEESEDEFDTTDVIISAIIAIILLGSIDWVNKRR